MNDIVSAKKLLNELDCGLTSFLNKMHMNYMEGLTDAEQMLFDHIRSCPVAANVFVNNSRNYVSKHCASTHSKAVTHHKAEADRWCDQTWALGCLSGGWSTSH